MEQERIYIKNAVYSRSVKAIETVLKPISIGHPRIYWGKTHLCRPLDVSTKNMTNLYEHSGFSEIACRLEYSRLDHLSSQLDTPQEIGEVKLYLTNENTVKNYNNENTNCYL